ncbi:MAG: hypothetical protein Q8L68_01865 [Methylococcales bacterium]|nr:hypothetical protein [Methylococcales bacterium]
MKFGNWESAVVAKDDAGKLSGAVDLGRPYGSLAVIIPTIDSASVTIHVSDTSDGTYRAIYYISTNDGDDDAAITTAGTGGITVVFPFFGFQHLKIVVGATQTTAAVTFKVRGFN